MRNNALFVASLRDEKEERKKKIGKRREERRRKETEDRKIMATDPFHGNDLVIYNCSHSAVGFGLLD